MGESLAGSLEPENCQVNSGQIRDAGPERASSQPMSRQSRAHSSLLCVAVLILFCVLDAKELGAGLCTH